MSYRTLLHLISPSGIQSRMNLKGCARNGGYIPLLGLITLGATGSLFATTTLTLKMFQENYYYWYHPYFRLPPHIPTWFNYLKQFSHYTDTGHIISLLCLADPTWIPIAFNTHFTITIAYWVSNLLLGLTDDDDGDFTPLPLDKRPWTKWTNGWWTLNHSLPVLVLGWMFVTQTHHQQTSLFGIHSLLTTFGWLYGWVILVYIPWRAITNNPVYSILRWDTPMWKIASVIALVHAVILLGNTIGSFLENNQL